MKKVLLFLIFCVCLNAKGLSLPFGFLTSLDKNITVKQDVVIITMNNSDSEMIIPTRSLRILKSDTIPEITKFKLVITDYILFEEPKILYITEAQYNYLKNKLYGLD